MNTGIHLDLDTWIVPGQILTRQTSARLTIPLTCFYPPPREQSAGRPLLRHSSSHHVVATPHTCVCVLSGYMEPGDPRPLPILRTGRGSVWMYQGVLLLRVNAGFGVWG